MSDDRVQRWRARQRQTGTSIDAAPGGHPTHDVTPGEVEPILAVTEEWVPVDRSHRKLAHRGSHTGQVWVSPSTLRRVLAAHGLVVAEAEPRQRARGGHGRTG